MVFRILYIVLGLLNIVVAVFVFKRATLSYFGLNIQLDGSRYFVSSAIFLIGFLFIVVASRKGFQFVKEEKYLKCTGCYDVFSASDTFEGKCPNCNGQLEDLAGYFERHPEEKEKSIRRS